MSSSSMTPERALIILDRLNTDERIEVDRGELKKAVAAAKAAMRKQISRNVDDKDYYNENGAYLAGWCPQCEKMVIKDNRFCCHCGQAIKW